MNICVIDGKIGKDIEVKTLSSGTNMYKFSIANTTGFGDNRVTSWFEITMFGKTGELVNKCFKKGDNIVVSGEITIKEHEGKKYVNMLGNSFSFPTRKSANGTATETSESGFEDIETDGDLPF